MTDNPYSAGQTDDREPWVNWPLVLVVFSIVLAVISLGGLIYLWVATHQEQWRRDREDVRYYIEAAKESRERAMMKD